MTSFELTVYVFGVYTGHRVTIWSFLMQASFQILSVWSHTAGSRSSIPQLTSVRASKRVCLCLAFPLAAYILRLLCCTYSLGYQPCFQNYSALPRHMDHKDSESIQSSDVTHSHVCVCQPRTDTEQFTPAPHITELEDEPGSVKWNVSGP